MEHPFSFTYEHPLQVDGVTLYCDVDVIAAIGADSRQPDGWDVDALYLVTDERSTLERMTGTGPAKAETRSEIPKGTPLFAQAMAEFADKHAETVHAEWLRERRAA